MWLKQFKPWKVLIVVDSIVVVGVLTCCALFYYMCDVKATQLNVQLSLIWEPMLYEKFVLQSRYYVHFQANTLGKGMNPLILPAMG